MPNNMAKRFHFGLAALLLPALIACTGQPSGPVKIDWQEGEMLAVGFLGYYDSFGAFEASPSYLQLTKTYPQIVEAAQVDCGIGRQIYLVIPRDPAATIAVDEEGSYITDDNRRVFYRSEEGRPVLLLNNWYEPNSLVVCTDNDGRSIEYIPDIDDVTGALKKDAAIHDISRPIPKPVEGLTFFDYGTDFNDNSLGVSVRLQAGRPILTMSAAPLEAIGYDPDSFVIADGDNEFNGINGLCKGVFLGTIGQDYNPVVCVLMDNGDIKKCTAFYAMRHGEPELSPVLPGFKDVTGFESGGGGEWVDEESGEDFYEYETIYALDARGGRTEIPHFVDYGHYMGKDRDAVLEVELSPDWRFYLSRFMEDGSLADVFNGYFSEKVRSDGPDVFDYRIETRSRIEDGDIVVENLSTTGTFTTHEKELSYEVELTGSDMFTSGTVFQDEILMDSYEGYYYDDED